MKCPECQCDLIDEAERCAQCGAVLSSGQQPPEVESSEVSLSAEQGEFGFEKKQEGNTDLGFLLDHEIDRIYGLDEIKELHAGGIRWGGFWRRASAFSIDVLVLFLLSSVLFYLSYVGYRVGLAAHHRTFSLDSLKTLSTLLFFGWVLLMGGYFVLFHGMDGRTVGKWLFGLRVVGPRQEPITYGQAFLRWLGMIAFAPVILGFLWILWSREKRGWHDFLAQTWVIRG